MLGYAWPRPVDPVPRGNISSALGDAPVGSHALCVCLSFQLLHLAGTIAVGFQCVLRDGASRAWGMVLGSLASSSLTHLPEKE